MFRELRNEQARPMQIINRPIARLRASKTKLYSVSKLRRCRCDCCRDGQRPELHINIDEFMEADTDGRTLQVWTLWSSVLFINSWFSRKQTTSASRASHWQRDMHCGIDIICTRRQAIARTKIDESRLLNAIDTLIRKIRMKGRYTIRFYREQISTSSNK